METVCLISSSTLKYKIICVFQWLKCYFKHLEFILPRITHINTVKTLVGTELFFFFLSWDSFCCLALAWPFGLSSLRLAFKAIPGKSLSGLCEYVPVV